MDVEADNSAQLLAVAPPLLPTPAATASADLITFDNESVDLLTFEDTDMQVVPSSM